MYKETLEEILKKSSFGDLIKPYYEGYSIINITNSMLQHFGAKHGTALMLDVDSMFEGADKIVFLLVDALGLNLINKAMSDLHLDAFSEISANGLFVPLTSVFPSTTAVALPSISTGLTPSEHGLLGYRFYSKEYGFLINSLFGKVANTEKCGIKIDINWYMPVKTSFERLFEVGVESYIVTKIDYIRSHFEKAVYRGAKEVPYLTSSDMFARIAEILKSAQKPTFISAYWWAVDALSHRYGPESEAVMNEISEVELMVSLLMSKMDANTLLIVTADHGQIYSPADKSVDLHDYEKISDSLMLPVSDLRAPYLYVKGMPGKEIFSALDGVEVLTKEEAFRAGYFGSSKKFLNRVGDFVFIIKDEKNYSYLSPQEEINLLGKHGGLSKDEMLVPLFMYRK